MAVELNEDDVISARLEFKTPDGSVAFNVLHFKFVSATPIGGGTPPFSGMDMSIAGPEIAEHLGGIYVEEWQAAAATSVSMTGVTVQNIYPTPKSRQYHYVFGAPQAGELATDALPLQDAPVLVKRTAFGQRWGIGRIFCVGTPEGGQASGILTDAQAALWNDFGEALNEQVEVVAGDYTLLFVPTLPSYDAFGVPRKLSIDEIVLTDKVIKTQRRRRPGKGI